MNNFLVFLGSTNAKKLTAFLLAFFILLTPFAPIFAQEISSSIPIEQSAPGPSAPTIDQTDLAPAAEDVPVVEAKPNPDIKPINGDTEPSSNSLVNNDPSTGLAPSVNAIIKQQVPQPDAASGALTYSYPIAIPPGRNGLQPSLSLNYNNQNGQHDSIFGYGWSVSIPYIERVNKTGSDKLYSSSYYNSSLSGELTDLGSGSFGSRVDNGEFLTYTLASSVWTVKDKNGTVYKFGTNA